MSKGSVLAYNWAMQHPAWPHVGNRSVKGTTHWHMQGRHVGGEIALVRVGGGTCLSSTRSGKTASDTDPLSKHGTRITMRPPNY